MAEYAEPVAPKESDNKKRNNGIKGIIILLVVCLVVMGGSFYFSRNYLVVYPIEGISMENTIMDGERALIFKTQKVHYDDIIIARASYREITLIKRVIGLEGDFIEIKSSDDGETYHVYRNGAMVDEEHIKEDMKGGVYYDYSVTVPQGCVFYLGDNRNNSEDSHNGYFIKVSDIKGIVFLRYDSNKKIKFL